MNAGLRQRSGPLLLLSLAAFFSLASLVAVIYEVTHQPTLGIELRRYESTSGGLIVERSTHEGLHPGDRIVAFQDLQGQWRDIDAMNMIRPWDYAVYHKEMADLLELNGALQAVLEERKSVHLRLEDSRVVPVSSSRHQVWSLPIDFFLSTLSANFAWLLGVAVKAFRPRRAGANQLLLFGLGVLVTFALHAMGHNMGMPIPIGADFMWAIVKINDLGVMLSAAACLALFLTFPNRLLPKAGIATIYVAAAALFLATETNQVERFFLQYFAFGIYALALPAGIVQWRTTVNLLDRTALKWVGGLVGGGVALIYPLAIMPKYLGYPGLDIWVVPIVATLVFTGLALAIARYRLFDLGRWWFEALLWGVGGMLVLLLDALFLFWIDGGGALMVALAVAGWLYFPLRQWLWHRLHPAAQKKIERYLPQFIDTLFSARTADELSANWQSLLRRIYSPLDVATFDGQANRIAIADDGMALDIPGLEGGSTLRLTGRDKGSRLYDSADLRLVETLYSMAKQASALRKSQEQVTCLEENRAREKELLVRDLHDGLGGLATNIALLADMAKQSDSLDKSRNALSNIASLSHEAVAEIRGFMQSLEDTDADWKTLAADMRHWGVNFLSPHEIALEFTTDIKADAPQPEPACIINLFRIYREALSNVVKHARASQVTVRLEAGPDAIRFAARDNGKRHSTQPVAGRMMSSGHGMENMRKRTEDLGGKLTVNREECVEVVVEIPAGG